MHTLTNKSGFLQFLRSTAADGAGEADSSRSWPAPARKPAALALKKSPPISTGAFAEGLGSATLSNAPFPAPVRENAFELPRPVAVAGASAAWAPPLRKSPLAVLGAGPGIRSEVEFSQPPRFQEKLSMRHGQFCRSC